MWSGLSENAGEARPVAVEALVNLIVLDAPSIGALDFTLTLRTTFTWTLRLRYPEEETRGNSHSDRWRDGCKRQRAIDGLHDLPASVKVAEGIQSRRQHLDNAGWLSATCGPFSCNDTPGLSYTSRPRLRAQRRTQAIKPRSSFGRQVW